MRTLCTGNGVWILVEKISCADQYFCLGSEVYFTSEKIDQQKLKKKKQIQAKQNNMKYREAPVPAFYSVIIVFVPF